MRIRGMALLGLWVLAPVAQACINASGTDHSGRRFDVMDGAIGKDLTDALLKPHERDRWLSEPYRTIDPARAKPDFDSLTDLGVLMLYQGQYVAAVRHFVFLERRYPGRYKTAANLGTALELAGFDQVALQWIRIGIARNQDAHERTEWLHARILEAKIAQARDAGYLATHSVAGVSFVPTSVPPLPTAWPAGNDGKPVMAWQLNDALAYQLHERAQFVRPKDPVVANLLLDWATLNLAGGPIENADALYNVAVDYGAPRDALMRERQAFIAQTIARVEKAGRRTSGYDCGICRPLNK